MENLKPGHRIFVNIPKHGFVGVGKVAARAVPIGEFLVDVNGAKQPLLDAPLSITDKASVAANANDPEKFEAVVGVEWIKDVPKDQGFWTKGLFASQLPACKLRNRFTLEKLTEHFGLEE